MGEWKECKLKDIVEFANTGLDAIKRAPIVEEDTGIKCLRIQDVSQNKKCLVDKKLAKVYACLKVRCSQVETPC